MRTWEGPIGEQIAKAIAQGYTPEKCPFHWYFYKVLKGQGPAAPLGQLDYVIEGVMIGGFALVAAPAQYRVTGVKTFMVQRIKIWTEQSNSEIAAPDNVWIPGPQYNNNDKQQLELEATYVPITKRTSEPRATPSWRLRTTRVSLAEPKPSPSDPVTDK